MKNFLSTFAICFILCGIFLFFGGFLILSNPWLTAALIALVISLLICAFLMHRSQLASEQYYVPAMDRELWNQFAQVLTRHGSDPQNIKFAYSMEELMLQLAFYGGYTILAEPVLAQLPANKNLTFIPLENDTVPAWAVWNRENISPALRLLLRELDIDP